MDRGVRAMIGIYVGAKVLWVHDQTVRGEVISIDHVAGRAEVRWDANTTPLVRLCDLIPVDAW